MKLDISKVTNIFNTSALHLVVFIFLLTTFNCNKNPISINDTKPGRRDYVWTVDTLFLPFSLFHDISGTSPNDVWICGPGGDFDKIFYHYDGKLWETDLIVRNFSSSSISSISSNDVWSCGYAGKIWHFNGTQWQQDYQLKIDSIKFIMLENIAAFSSTNILTAGQYFDSLDYFGLILKYDGILWSEIKIPKIRTAFANIKRSEDGKIYLWGITNEQYGDSKFQFYELLGDSLREIYKGSLDNGSLLQLSGKTYFIIGHDFFSYTNNTFNKIARLTSATTFLNVGWGRNEKDVFLGMSDGIAHFNGDNTIYLFQSNDKIFVRRGIIFDRTIFFIGRDKAGNTLLIQGNLNE